MFIIETTSVGHYQWADMAHTSRAYALSFAKALSVAMGYVADDGQTMQSVAVNLAAQTASISCDCVADGVLYTMTITIKEMPE